MFFDVGFHGDVFENFMIVEEEKAVPEPAHSSVAVLEGVDEFKFVVEDAASNEWVVIALKEIEQIIHQKLYALSLWRNV